MKQISKIGVLLLMAGLLLLSGCQKEFSEIEEPSVEDVIKPNTNLATLILRVTFKDGSSDNLIDGSSCTSLKFPVSIELDNQILTINSEEDIEKLKSNYGQLLDDIDLVYPITVILDDYSELVVTNEDQLENLQEDCFDNIDDRDIECIDFVYPFELAVFNTETQVADVVKVSDDKNLYYLFNDIEDILVTINYPITLILSDGSNIEIHNNEDLEESIDDAEDDCEEEEEDREEHREFISHLISNVWEVSLFADAKDETLSFTGYTISFGTDETLLATKGGNEIPGEWEFDIEDNENELEISFDTDDSPLIWLNEEWEVVSSNETSVFMEAPSEIEGLVKKLTISVSQSNE